MFPLNAVVMKWLRDFRTLKFTFRDSLIALTLYGNMIGLKCTFTCLIMIESCYVAICLKCYDCLLMMFMFMVICYCFPFISFHAIVYI